MNTVSVNTTKHPKQRDAPVPFEVELNMALKQDSRPDLSIATKRTSRRARQVSASFPPNHRLSDSTSKEVEDFFRFVGGRDDLPSPHASFDSSASNSMGTKRRARQVSVSFPPNHRLSSPTSQDVNDFFQLDEGGDGDNSFLPMQQASFNSSISMTEPLGLEDKPSSDPAFGAVFSNMSSSTPSTSPLVKNYLASKRSGSNEEDDGHSSCNETRKTDLELNEEQDGQQTMSNKKGGKKKFSKKLRSVVVRGARLCFAAKSA